MYCRREVLWFIAPNSGKLSAVLSKANTVRLVQERENVLCDILLKQPVYRGRGPAKGPITPLQDQD